MPRILNMHKSASEENTLSQTDGSAPLFQIAGFNVYYDRAHAVQDVSFEVARGVLGIVGRNGMGKTSLCNGITGICPAVGRVRLKGQDIAGLDRKSTRLNSSHYCASRMPSSA